MVRARKLRLVSDAGTRTDERHLAAQDVDQLRQLVQARLAQQAAERRHVALRVELVGAVGVDPALAVIVLSMYARCSSVVGVRPSSSGT